MVGVEDILTVAIEMIKAYQSTVLYLVIRDNPIELIFNIIPSTYNIPLEYLIV
jgi:hypothetical protein